MRKYLLLVFFFLSSSWAANLALDINAGAALSYKKFKAPAPNFQAHLWYKFDQMVFLGASSGYIQKDSKSIVPINASLFMRLPIGGQVLPIATADVGIIFPPEFQFSWQASGGLDIKNGDKSSILILIGHQYYQKMEF